MTHPPSEKDARNVPGALAPGAQVGEYVIEELLSSGGFGVVYHARDSQQRPVAVKVSKHSARSITAQQLVWQQNEIEALTRLRHPSLVEVRGFGFLEDGRLYLVMELVRGAVLGQYLQEKGPLEVLEALRLTRRIAEALAFCHESKVLHLDLKPANIIITDPVESRVNVLDFGLARLSSGFRVNEGGPIAGTLSYLAPECFFGAADRFSEKVDLYALGTLLYEMLSCALPFPGNASYAALGALKRSGKMTPLEEVAPQVPAPVAALVRSLLEPDPAQRFGGAARLVARLQALYFDLLRGDTGQVETGPPRPAELSSDEAPFVGRQRELALLREAVDAVSDRKGGAMMLVGEAGMGKSRLISEVLLPAEVSSRVMVSYGRCRQLGELVPYSPLREALGQMVELILGRRGESGQRVRGAAGVSLAGEAQELRRLVPELSRLLPEGAERGAEDALVQGLGPERVGKALMHLLDALGAARPLVLVLEDVHWADEGTLAVLSRLTATPPPGVLVLCTTRPPVRLTREGALQMLSLGAMTPEENDQLLSVLAGGAAPAVVRALAQSVPFLSTGNPLVSVRILRDLKHGGYLTREADGRIRLSERLQSEYRPPESLSTTGESAPEEPGLKVAALIYQRFQVSDLAAMGLYTPEEVRSAVAAAEAQRQGPSGVEPGAGPSGPAREPGAAEPLMEAHACVEAGLEADGQLDSIGASRHLRKAFTLLSGLPAGRERDDLLVRALYELVRIGCLLGGAAEMLQHLERGEALLPHPTSEQALALNSAYARAYYAKGDFPKALEYSARCLASEQEPARRAYRYVPSNIMGRALCGTGKFGPSIPVLAEAATLAVEAGDHVEQTHSEGILAVALAHCGQYRKAREHAASAARLALRLGNPVRMAASLFYYATLAEAEFRWDEGVKRSAELLAFVEAQGITGLYQCVGTTYAGRHQFHIGRLERARHLLHHALELTRRQGSSYGQAWAYAFLGDVEFVAGRPAEAKQAYEQGLELSNGGAKDEQAAPLCLIGLAHLEALAGGPVESVRARGNEAIARLKAVENVANLIPTLQRYAEALEELGDSEGAAPFHEERRQLVARLGLTECDFWPQVVPGPQMEPLPPRQYWRRHSSKVSSSNIRPMAPEDVNAETVVRAAAPRDEES